MESAPDHVKAVRIIGRGVDKFSEFPEEIFAKPLRFGIVVRHGLGQILFDCRIEFDAHRVRLDCTRFRSSASLIGWTRPD